MGKDDQTIIPYLTIPENFCDFINGTMFQGMQILDPQKIRPIPQRNTATVKGDDGTPVILDGIRDVVMKHDFRGIYAIFATEAQGKMHYAMPVRAMGYDAAEYLNQVKALARRHRNAKDLKTPGEFLSGLSADDKLVPVYTIILYYGTEEWTAPLSLREMMEFPPNLEPYKKLVPDYRVTLIRANEANPENFRGSWRLIFAAMHHAHNGEEMEAYLQTHRREYENLEEDAAEVLLAMLRELEGYRELKNIYNNREEKEEVTMCKAFDEIREKYRGIGYQEGKTQNRILITGVISAMTKEGRTDELPRLGTDPDFLEEMQCKYFPETYPEEKTNQGYSHTL